MNNIRKTITVNMSMQLVGKFISVGLGLVNIGLLTRHLGQEGYGQFSLIIAYLGTFSVISDLGFQLTLVRQLSDKNKKIDINLGSYFYLKLILTVVFIGISLLTLILLPYSNYIKIGIIIGSIGFGIGNINTFFTALFQTELRLDIVSFVDIVSKLIITACIVIFSNLSMGLYPMVNSILLGNIFATMLYIYFLRGRIHFFRFFSAKEATKLFMQSLPVGLVLILTSLYVKVDSFILSLYRDIIEIGFYSLAYKILENVLLLWGFYMAIVYPLFAKFYISDRKTFRMLFHKSIFLGVFFSLIGIILIYIFAPYLIYILAGNDFIQSSKAIKILALSLPFLIIDNIYYNYFIASANTKILLRALPIALVFNVSLNLILVPSGGYLAASTTTVLTEILICSIFTYFFLKNK